jgi:hypothetical protein
MGKTRGGRDHLEVLGIDDVDWIYLAYDEVKWRAVMNAVMNLRLP